MPGELLSAPVFGEFLRDKDVVLVGPSDAYRGSGRGGEIDAFDLVVRLNWGCPVPDGLRHDLGGRTDVLYKRMLASALPTSEDVKAWTAEGVRWVITSDTSLTTPHARHFNGVVRGRFPWQALGDLRGQLVRDMRTSPLIGTLAIVHLLKTRLRSLTVMNCDFYAGGYHAGYGGQDYRRSRGRALGQPGPSHDTGAQLRYLNRVAKNDPRLLFDASLQQLVKQAIRGQDLSDVVAVIPARYESGRFPGKPLAEIAGKAMVLHVCERAAQAVGAERVIVATDDRRIADVVEAAGYRAEMTGEALTGTDRVAQVAKRVKASIYLNVQGDEPLLEPDDLLTLIDAKRAAPRSVANGMCALQPGQADDATVVKAVVSERGRLLYASRAAVPATKESHAASWRQLGLYAFSREELKAFEGFGRRAAVEQLEDVEILRFLELGTPVRMVELSGAGQAVDLPAHIEIVEQLLRAQDGPLSMEEPIREREKVAA